MFHISYNNFFLIIKYLLIEKYFTELFIIYNILKNVSTKFKRKKNKFNNRANKFKR